MSEIERDIADLHRLGYQQRLRRTIGALRLAAFTLSAFPATVVDRVGAGDAFCAGLLWGLLTGDLKRAPKTGPALGALACTIAGDHARFSPDEVEGVIANPAEALLR